MGSEAGEWLDSPRNCTKFDREGAIDMLAVRTLPSTKKGIVAPPLIISIVTGHHAANFTLVVASKRKGS
jgi:hypothetical protein